MATISPITVKTISYADAPGFSSKRKSLYNTPGTYTWSKTTDSTNNEMPAIIIFEICSGGGGGTSGILISSNQLDKTNGIGAAGGSPGIPITKIYNVNEINDTVSFTVGAGGAGGNKNIKSSSEEMFLVGVSGSDGLQSIVGPLYGQFEFINSPVGRGSTMNLEENNVTSIGGFDDSGYAGKYVTNNSNISSKFTTQNTFGGGAGAGFLIDQSGNYIIKNSGQTPRKGGFGGNYISTQNSHILGQDGMDALEYGCGGGGGGITLVSPGDIAMSGKGGNGKNGYVRIKVIFSIDTVIQ